MTTILTKLFKVFLVVLILITILCFSAKFFNIHLNISSSLPYGAYYLQDKQDNITKGDIILFCLDEENSKLIKDANILAFGSCPYNLAPIGKKVIATSYDKVQIDDNYVAINGNIENKSKRLKLKLKNYPKATFNRALKKGEYIVLSNHEDSFDSRYFGVVKIEQIKGILKPLITF